ncbi:hydrogenase expression protein HypF [Streptomyces sparsogenes]|uniref:hydrogenase expression protein HypF n=1 Tax=Streptomyces sparsogenes TaxID=67365 RepID=UPI0033DC86BF
MLTRLHMPAGKAIALAAMPTAVLMGMGLTPQLAQATSPAEDRYKPGPCVTQSDEADKDSKDSKAGDKGNKSTDKSGEASKSSGDKSSDKSSGDRSSGDKDSAGKGGDGKADEPGPTPTPSATSDPASSGDEADGKTDDKTPEQSTPSPTPSETESENPLDPLGLGDAIKDIFTGGGDEDGDKEGTDEPSATPSPSGSPTGSSDKPSDPVGDTADKAGDAAKDATKDTADKADNAGDAEDKADGDKADGATPTATPTAPSPSASESGDGKEPFPCPTYDAEAYENAESEPTTSLLPDEPWTLKSTLLTLHGLDYKGIVEVKTYSGEIKKVLKFTAGGIEIKDLHQLTVGAGGTTTHVAAREGSTSTFDNGPITMYTEELSGNLLGIVPITFSPKSPPPLNLPEVFFTDVTVTQAGQFGGDLTIPGMHLYKTGG